MKDNGLFDFFSEVSERHTLNCMEKDDRFRSLIKEASAIDLKDHSDQAFALPEQRLFPIANAVLTEASLRFLSHYPQDIPSHAVQALEKAASIFGVTLNNKIPCEDPEVHYLIPEKNKFPVFDKESCKLAEHYILTHSEIPLPNKVQMSVNLCKHAENLGHRPSDDLKNLAFDSPFDREKAEAQLKARHYMSADGEGYLKLAAALKQSHPIEEVIEIASVIERMDYDSGIDKQWGKSLDDPFSCLLQKRPEIAKEASESIRLYDKGINEERLSYIPRDTFQEILGNEVTEEIFDKEGPDFERAKQVIDMMPNSVKKDLQEGLQGYLDD